MVEFSINNSWLFIGRIIAIGSGAMLTIAFANLLSPVAFGTYKYVLAMAAVIGAFTLTGMGGSAMRAVAQGHKHIIPRLFKICLLASIPGSIIAASIAGYYFYMGNSVLGSGMAFIAVSHLFSGLILHKSLLMGGNQYQASAIYGIPRSLIPIIILIGTLFITDNLIAILGAYFFGTLIFAYLMYSFALTRMEVDGGMGHDQASDDAVHETTVYGFHLSVMGSTSVVVGQLDQLLLWHFVGPAELALYAIAFAPVRELKGLLENASPILFTRFATRTKEELRASIPLRTGQMFLVSLILGIAYVIGAPLLFHYFFPQYTSALIMSQILAVILLVHPKTVVENALSAQARTKIRYMTTGGTLAARGVLSLVLIPLYGFPGAVAALILAEFSQAIIFAVAYRYAYTRTNLTETT